MARCREYIACYIESLLNNIMNPKNNAIVGGHDNMLNDATIQLFYILKDSQLKTFSKLIV